MRYPNLRYGNPLEFQYYAAGIPLAHLSRRFRRSERTIKEWLSGEQRVPWWVPEIMRLQALELDVRLRYMGLGSLKAPLATVTAIGGLVSPSPTPKENRTPEGAADSFKTSCGN